MESNWAPRSDLKPGDANILHEPVVDRKNIIFPPLHIRLGLIKQFVEVLPTEGDCFKYFILAFPSLSFKKIKAGVFDCPQLTKDENFIGTISEHRKKAWLSFRNLVKDFFWKYTSVELYHNCLETFGELRSA